MTAPEPEIVTVRFADDGVIPNNPALPVVLMRRALDPALGGGEIGRIHAANGWAGGWSYTIFDYQHWHPNAHEALSVISGHADVLLGGLAGQVFRIEPGDTVVLPAGTGHRRLSASADFLVRGAYPPGQEARETRAGTPAERGDGPARIAKVALPATDPVFGPDGPLIRAWRG
jgi:uncharacterized protein YjlB